tara:strand:- start:18 stop:683 length:666 start_codon:yes stop_codon:yes gene_type:complete
MPAKTEKQRRFMGAELSRKRKGKKTRTDMTESQLEEFASKQDEDLVDASKTVSGKLNSEGMWVPLKKPSKPHAPGMGNGFQTQTPAQMERNKKERERASKQRREFLMRKSVEAIDKYISKEDKVLSSKDLLPQQDNEGNFIPNESLPYTPDVNDVLSLAADAIQTLIKDDVRGNQTTRYGRRDAKQQTKRRGYQNMKTRQGSRDQWNQQTRTAQEKKRKEQ